MAVLWDNIDVLIGSTGLMCDSVSIESENNLRPIYSIGNKGTANLSPSGPIKHTINISYVPIIDQDPNFHVASGIKNLSDDSSYDPVVLEVGTLTGFGYLRSLSYSARPNDVLRANATYESFVNLSGTFSEQTYSGDYKNKDNVAHGWTTFFSNQGNYYDSPIYNLQYNFNSQWAPRYTLGKNEAVQITHLSSREQVDLEREDYRHIQFSGEDSFDSLVSNNSTGIDFLSLDIVSYPEYDDHTKPTTGSFTHLPINLSGFKITQSNVNARLNDLIKNNISLSRFY